MAYRSTMSLGTSVRRLGILVTVLAVVGAIGAVPAAAPETRAAAPAWMDRDRTPDERATALLAQMTLDEKIGQMTQLEKGSVGPEGVASLLLGSVLSGGGGSPARNDAESWYRMVQTYQDAALGTRLGIPLLYGVDAVHGHNNVVGATIFPHAVGLGATGDPDLVERIGRATAVELAATGIRWNFAPVVAVAQDVRWGRTYEAFGEDPLLVSTLGSASVRGLQGADLTADDAVVATPKHFVGDGGTTFGSSTTTGYLLDQGVAEIDDATLRSVHLPPYTAALDAGARIVMASFSSTLDGKVHADRRLLTEVLKGELGFTGFVVSDWAAVDQVDADYHAAVARSIEAGIDMVMVPYDGPRFQDAVRAGLATGTISPARVDDAVLRILRVKLEMGLFEHPMPPEAGWASVGSKAHRALARSAVSASAVLLASAPGVLPVRPTESVLLAGVGADDIGLQSGGWTISWQGGLGETTIGTTIADALDARLGDRLVFEGPRTIPEDVHADVGIVVLAEGPYAEGVGDSKALAINAGDLLVRMRPRVDRLIVILLSGRPVILDSILPTADAVIAAWLPGTEGDGVADVLLGDVPFSGTTPYTWPRTPGEAPRTGKAACDGAVFPRGYGIDATGRLLGPAACP